MRIILQIKWLSSNSLIFILGTLEFNIVITRKSGYFEITKEEEVVVEGYIDNLYDTQDFKKEIQEIDDNKLILKTTDIYKDFRISGYNYMNYFQTIICSNIEGKK